ncbi:MAG TPA: response regulator transcription factor [Bacteriovoracaceae bacterium]|nr:response regulator transcription factor [Bacteriovoracaceae bacterium]
MNRILLVEDSKEIYQMVLQSTANLCELTWVTSLQEARDILNKHSYDLLLLDVDLPDGNGIEFCSSIQSTHSHCPIFFLTGHLGLSDKVMGFSAGADDYITKPFSPLELRARIEGRLRKNKQQVAQSDMYNWNELQICKSRQEVSIREQGVFKKVDLTALEFKILMYFATRPGEVINRDKILNDIWGEDIHVYSRSVDTHVSKLRKKLGAVSHIVESIHGSGYKFSPTN